MVAQHRRAHPRLRRRRHGRAEVELVLVAPPARVREAAPGGRADASRGDRVWRAVAGRARGAAPAEDSIRKAAFIRRACLCPHLDVQYRCRQIMTRPDFLEGAPTVRGVRGLPMPDYSLDLDRANVIAIDVGCLIRMYAF